MIALVLVGMALLISPITLVIGLYKVLFQKEDKKFGIQLLIFTAIALIIGLGTCAQLSKNGF